MDGICIGSLVHLPKLRLEAVVEDRTERGLCVAIDGPNEAHELFGASMWVAPADARLLKVAEVGGPPIGSSVRATLPGGGEAVDAQVLDVRQGLKRGAAGIRVRVRTGEESLWLHLKDIMEASRSDDHSMHDAESAALDEEAPLPAGAPLAAGAPSIETDNCWEDSFVNESDADVFNETAYALVDDEAKAAAAVEDEEEEELEEEDKEEEEEEEEEEDKQQEEQALNDDDDRTRWSQEGATAGGPRYSPMNEVDDSMASPHAAEKDEQKEEEEEGEQQKEDEEQQEEGEGEEDEDGDDDGQLEPNEAVVVAWRAKTRGSAAREYNAVVDEVRGARVRVQFDSGGATAWLPASSVQLMPDADDDEAAAALPAWARAGTRVEAVDPLGENPSTWHAGTVNEARQGVCEGSEDDGLRLWVRYELSGLCQWLKRGEVREVGGTAAAPLRHTPPAPKSRARSRSQHHQPEEEKEEGAPRAKRPRSGGGGGSQRAAAASAAQDASPTLRLTARQSKRAERGRSEYRKNVVAGGSISEADADDNNEANKAADEVVGDGATDEEADRGSATSSDRDGQLEPNEAVVVAWRAKTRGSASREYNAVVMAVKRARGKPVRVRVQFDSGGATAWLPASSVQLMPDAAAALPAWARVGTSVEAVDPFATSRVWHAGTVDEARQGVCEGSEDDGLRLWVRYELSGLCQWLKRGEVRLAGSCAPQAAASAPRAHNSRTVAAPALAAPALAAPAAVAPAAAPPASAAICRGAPSRSEAASVHKLQVLCLSRRSGHVGDVLWILLSDHALDSTLHAPVVQFGQVLAPETELLAGNVVACTVPPHAPAGTTGVRLSVRSVADGDAAKAKPISPGCSMRFEVLPPHAGAAAGHGDEDVSEGDGGAEELVD